MKTDFVRSTSIKESIKSDGPCVRDISGEGGENDGKDEKNAKITVYRFGLGSAGL